MNISQIKNIIVSKAKQARSVVVLTGLTVIASAPAQAAFDPLTIAAEKADFTANVLVGTGIAVGLALVGAAGYVMINFVRRGAR